MGAWEIEYADKLLEQSGGFLREALGESGLSAEVMVTVAAVAERHAYALSRRDVLLALRAAAGGAPRAEPAGDWTTLGELRLGDRFETRDGIRAVKNRYLCDNGNPGCLLIQLGNGRYAHFPPRSDEAVRKVEDVELRG